MDSTLVPSIANDYNDNNNKLHVAMFPWLAFGHMMPFLELAKLIAQRGHRISFISTPRNIDRLPTNLPPHISPLITFVKLPLPQVENLPQDAEATADLSLQDVWYLKKAYDLLQEPLAQFIQASHPDWILFDFVPYWLPTIAHELDIPSAYFSIFTASCIGYICPPSGEEDYRKVVEDYIEKPKWVPFPSTVAHRLFEALRGFRGFRGDESNISDFYRFREALARPDLIVVRSCMEFEPEYLKLLEEIHQKPVIPAGVLPPTPNDSDVATNEKWKTMKEWLDKQEKGSVVYIAFGSEATPTQKELTEIALGLELSELPFFWVLRPCRGLADGELLKLPDGFEERTKGRGVLCTGWAPQLKILEHDSVGGFLTHSGWSSVVEALQFARAIIILTFHADQGLNAKLLQEKEIGYVIPRSELDGSFTRNSVVESLRLVIVDEEGKIYRDKAKEMAELFGDRDRQGRYVDNLLDYLRNHRLKSGKETFTGEVVNDVA